jgi:hypothetical protein
LRSHRSSRGRERDDGDQQANVVHGFNIPGTEGAANLLPR